MIKKQFNIEDDNSKQELINILKDMVDIANQVADKTSYRESAFEIVLTNLVEDFFEKECDCDGIDRIKYLKTDDASVKKKRIQYR